MCNCNHFTIKHVFAFHTTHNLSYTDSLTNFTHCFYCFAYFSMYASRHWMWN